MKSLKNVLSDFCLLILKNPILAFVSTFASIVLAILALYSVQTQNVIFWAWISGLLGLAFFLFWFSLSIKSLICFFLSLVDLLYVVTTIAMVLFGQFVIPLFTGWNLCIILLIFFAINTFVHIISISKRPLTKIKKQTLIILLIGACLSAILCGIAPEWVSVVVLDTATIVAMLSELQCRRGSV